MKSATALSIVLAVSLTGCPMGTLVLCNVNSEAGTIKVIDSNDNEVTEFNADGFDSDNANSLSCIKLIVVPGDYTFRDGEDNQYVVNVDGDPQPATITIADGDCVIVIFDESAPALAFGTAARGNAAALLGELQP